LVDLTALKFAKTHEWVRIDGDRATIGITDFAVGQLTDLVFIQLPQVGDKFKAGQSIGEVESVKAVSDLYAPVSGEVVAANTALADDLATLSQDPFGAGWIIQLKVTDSAALAGLMDHKVYEQFCQSEEH
jgi:glycine cleavage system H protein